MGHHLVPACNNGSNQPIFQFGSFKIQGSTSPTFTNYHWPFQDPKLEVLTIYKAYCSGLCKGISLEHIPLYGTVPPHFRILKFPLKLWAFVKSKALFGFPPCGGHTLTPSQDSRLLLDHPLLWCLNLPSSWPILSTCMSYTVYPLVN